MFPMALGMMGGAGGGGGTSLQSSHSLDSKVGDTSFGGDMIAGGSKNEFPVWGWFVIGGVVLLFGFLLLRK